MMDANQRKSELAYDTAELLVESYHAQDQIEDIQSLDEKQSTDRASEAYEAMGKVYFREFSEIDWTTALSAARNHLNSLFIQDIIENFGDGPVLYHSDWERVNGQLHSLCEKIGLDSSYADRMTEFFRLHGQDTDGWKTHAHAAHQIKLEHIIASDYWVSLLSPYFVQGVELHDENRWEEAIDVIAAHYYQLFNIKEDPIREDPKRS